MPFNFFYFIFETFILLFKNFNIYILNQRKILIILILKIKFNLIKNN